MAVGVAMRHVVIRFSAAPASWEIEDVETGTKIDDCAGVTIEANARADLVIATLHRVDLSAHDTHGKPTVRYIDEDCVVMDIA